MTAVKFNINQAFQDVFNVYARIPAFLNIPKGQDNNSVPSFSEAKGDTAENPYNYLHVAVTGEIVWDRIIVDYDNEGVLTQYNFPIETVAELSCPNNIINTPLAGRKGSVKEYISRGDWEIILRGFMINYEEELYPQDMYKEMVRVFETDKSMRVKSRILNDAGIFDVVIKDVKFPPMEGFANCQPFEILLWSDEPIELELTDV